MVKKRDIPHRHTFENFGESHTRFLAESRTDEVGPAARAWLAEKQAGRDEEAASKRDAREEETLRIAKRANRIAWIAAAIAAISSAKEIKWLVSSVISYLSK